MGHFFVIRIWSFVIFSSFGFGHSSFLSSAEPLQINLVSTVTSVQPGTPFHVGLHLVHKEHYHTYWKFPGIVGVPTDMKWDLPPDWKAGGIEWPAPERVMMFQIKAQGFHGEVLLPMKLTPPATLKPGETVTLKGKATWMCCGQECNPGFKDLELRLPVAAAPPEVDERWQKPFEKAQASAALPLVGWQTEATRSGSIVTLRLTPQAGTAALKTDKVDGIFFTEDGYINADKAQRFTRDGDSLVVTLEVSTYFTEKPPAELRGVLWLEDHTFGKGAVIRAPFAE